MKKRFFSGFALVLMLGFASIVLSGCDAFASSLANEYSSNSEIGLVFTMDNESSYTVTYWDSTGACTLEPGDSASVRYNKNASIHNVRYSPSDKVKVSQSGTTFTFRDR